VTHSPAATAARPAVVPGSRLVEFETILALTRSMDAQAADGDWAALGATERQRDHAIRSFFATAPAVDEASWIASGVREILATDQRIMDLARRRMADLAGNIGGIRKGRHAQRAYQENSDSAAAGGR
jgi:hypothetical protein